MWIETSTTVPTTWEKLLFLHQNWMKLDYWKCGMTVYSVLWPNFYLSDNYISDINCIEKKWLCKWVFVYSSVLSCVISWNEKCCDVLCHSYVDPASIYRILPKTRPDPDPNRIQIHWIRPVHPYSSDYNCTASAKAYNSKSVYFMIHFIVNNENYSFCKTQITGCI